MTPEQLAEACAESLWEGDGCSASHGFELVRIAPGSATVSMTVNAAMVNGHNICHGGMLFTLADSAFAFACNTYNRRVVAQHCSIQFLKPAALGDSLSATANERLREGRSGIYDVTVHRGDEVIAEFRGFSREIDGQHLAGEY